jgi:hypothetical protein
MTAAEESSRKFDEISTQLVDVRIALAALTAETRAANSQAASRDASHTDHEMRLRKVERAVWLAAGAGLVGGGALGTIASQILGGS